MHSGNIDTKDITKIILPKGIDGILPYRCYYDIPHTTKLHEHTFIEVALVANGNGVHFINGKKTRVAKGDFFIFDKAPAHNFFPVTDENNSKMNVVNLLITDSFMEKFYRVSELTKNLQYFFAEKKNDILFHKRLGLKETNLIDRIFEKFFYESMLDDKLSDEMVMSYFIQLLVYVDRADTLSDSQVEYTNRVEAALAYIHENYNKQIKQSDISEITATSQSHFSKIFKRAMGESITEYIQKIRLNRATELLISTNQPVQDIAREVGYSNYRFFYDIFKKRYGVSPKSYAMRYENHITT